MKKIVNKSWTGSLSLAGIWLMGQLVCVMALPTFAYQELSAVQKLREPHVNNRVLLKRKQAKGNFMAGIGQYLASKKVGEFKHAKLEIIDFSSEHSMAEALFLYGLDPSVEFVEPDFLVFASELVPNDTLFSLQWGLLNDSDGISATDVDINAPLLWQATIGDPSIIVVVLDTGVNFLHNDLAANMWQNPDEVANNGIDDDLNGYIDDVYGINTDPNNLSTMDDNGHGSHVAGIIAGVGNNAMGISGVMQSAKIITCKFLSENGSGSTSDAIKCLDYILDLKTRATPVNIVASNNSWATTVFSESLYDAIKLQEDANIAFVAAADNYGLNNDLFATYPANYELANVISVAAVDRAGKLANFSNFGRHSVHVAAPGVQIQSTALGSLYVSLDGTSMAAPFVTGLLGLLSHHFPKNTMVQNKNLAIASQKPLEKLKGLTMSGGIIRGADEGGVGAISCRDRPVFQTIRPKKDLVSYELNNMVDVHVLNINCADPGGDFSGILHPSAQQIDFYDDGVGPDLYAVDGVYSASFMPTEPGAYELDIAQKYAVNLEVYDSTLWHSYRLSKNENFHYINFVGTKIKLADDDVYGLKLPFKVPFAKDAVGLSHVYIGSNGTLSLSDHEILDFSNKELPVEGFASILAPLWVDLDPSSTDATAGVFYQISGEEPHRQLVVEWRNVKYRTVSDKVTFEVVLSEDSPEIIYSYQDLNLNDAELNGGSSATVGIQVRDMGANLSRGFLPIADQSTFTLVYNSAPLADAGSDQTVNVGQSIRLDSLLSRDLENPAQLNFWWRQVSGPSLEIHDPHSQNTLITGTEEGEAILSLKVTDDGGAYASDTVTITITSPDTKELAKSANDSRRSGHRRSKGHGDAELGSGVSNLDIKAESVNTAPMPPTILAPKAAYLVGKDPLNLVAQNATDRENDLLTYEFEIYDKADFSNLIYAKRSISSGNGAFASLTLPKLSANITYFWRVRAFDGKLFSAWSKGEFRLFDESQEPTKAAQSPIVVPAAGCSTTDAQYGWWVWVMAGLFIMRYGRKSPHLGTLNSSK